MAYDLNNDKTQCGPHFELAYARGRSSPQWGWGFDCHQPWHLQDRPRRAARHKARVERNLTGHIDQHNAVPTKQTRRKKKKCQQKENHWMCADRQHAKVSVDP